MAAYLNVANFDKQGMQALYQTVREQDNVTKQMFIDRPDWSNDYQVLMHKHTGQFYQIDVSSATNRFRQKLTRGLCRVAFQGMLVMLRRWRAVATNNTAIGDNDTNIITVDLLLTKAERRKFHRIYCHDRRMRNQNMTFEPEFVKFLRDFWKTDTIHDGRPPTWCIFPEDVDVATENAFSAWSFDNTTTVTAE